MTLLSSQMKAKSTIVGVILLLIPIGCDPNEQKPLPNLSGMAQVIDGDSLRIGNTEVRLWGIDAVELYQTCIRGRKTWECGKAAKSDLADKVNTQRLVCQKNDTDPYGRIVAECFLGQENINAWVVRQGYALAYRRFSKKFIADGEQTKAGSRGIWNATFLNP